MPGRYPGLCEQGKRSFSRQRHRFLLLFCKLSVYVMNIPCEVGVDMLDLDTYFQNLLGAFLRQVPKIQTQLNA